MLHAHSSSSRSFRGLRIFSGLLLAGLCAGSAAASSVTASKDCLTLPCTVVEAKFTLLAAQTIQWQAVYRGTPTQGHSFFLSTVASNLADIPLTTSGQASGTKFLQPGTYFISIRLALMGPGTYTVTFNPSRAARAQAHEREAATSGGPTPPQALALPGAVRLSEERAAALDVRLGADSGARGERTANALLAAFGPLLRSSPRDELRQTSAESDGLGQTHLRLRQFVDGRPVIGGELIVHLDSATRAVRSLEGRFLESTTLRAQPELSAQAALEALLASAPRAEVASAPELVYVFGPQGDGRLAWAGDVSYVDESDERQLERVFVDAETGAQLDRHPRLARALNREVWDAQHGTDIFGIVRLIAEGGSSTDAVAQNAYTFTGAAWNYFKARHNWDSYDNASGLLHATVHYDVGLSNAFWDFNRRLMYFGDGDGVTSGPLGNALDVVAHEVTHGVTQATADLVYANESGALNEAMSDVFGAATEARERGLSANTWLIGEDTWTPAISGDALRSMSNPTSDAVSSDYYPERFTGTSDNGGVHRNSGIANLAFFLTSQGGRHPRGKTTIDVPAIGMPAAEAIFFRALRFHMGSNESFHQACQHTALSARELFGYDSPQQRTLCQAWPAVGVSCAFFGDCLTVGGGPRAPASLSVVSEACRGLNTVSWSGVAGATRYEVWGSLDANDFTTGVVFYSGSALSKLINVPGTREIRVRSCDASGCGPFSLAHVVARRIGGCL